VLKALAGGADGVLITGCHPGECHYLEQNYKALRRYKLLQKMLAQFGIEPERVKLVWASAAEGVRLAHEISKMVEEIRALGPLNWSGSVLSNGSSSAPALTGEPKVSAQEVTA
jgi:F420-non-reducing hydrogenase iron-sulfur subunit